MTWQVPAGHYRIEVQRDGGVEPVLDTQVEGTGLMQVRLALSALEPVTINVARVTELGS